MLELIPTQLSKPTSRNSPLKIGFRASGFIVEGGLIIEFWGSGLIGGGAGAERFALPHEHKYRKIRLQTER